ncbi:MAG: hypothetical protein HY432_01140 [Candidatus Liptonbacteria bacterium]|nr:hypothetical protein [Candidatus Liptonbacteria bacterium]
MNCLANIHKIAAKTAVLLAAFFVFFSGVSAEAAASLYLAPPSGTFTLGSTFTVSIYVNTGGQAINAIEANLSFPADKLQVVSPTTGKSLIQIWVAQPSYSNIDGTLKFQGAIPTPGINTDAGLLSTITFRVKSIGTATLRILDDSKVLLNDGRGTDVLGQTTDGIYYLALPPPQGPDVTSRTNPDQESWYNIKTATLEWNAPSDIQGYSYVLDQGPAGEPDDISEGTRTRVAYNNISDGTYYFHIKSLRQGAWGGVTDYVIRVDNTPPAAFKPSFSPGSRTSNNRPIIDFVTTDVASGIDHYELKIIPLNSPEALVAKNTTPFFIEASPPYSRILDQGRYDVVVRAYDRAGNYFQTESKLTITAPFLNIIYSEGLNIGGVILGWQYVLILVLALSGLMIYLTRWIWKRHLRADEYLLDVLKHPSISGKLAELKEKQKDYSPPRPSYGESGESGVNKGLMLIFLIFAMNFGILTLHAQAAEDSLSNVRLDPPVVTLFPRSISNDEILYIGGNAGVPQAQVLIYLQNIDTGATENRVAVTDENGVWFYSFPQFLEASRYIAWTQLKVANDMSPPSPKFDLLVAKTAIQIGDTRLSYENFYLFLLIIFALAFIGLLAFVLYHGYHARRKNERLKQAIKDAEDSIKRGFAVLRKDIELELNLVRRAKLKNELSVEEKMREEKLFNDLEDINRYINKEVW